MKPPIGAFPDPTSGQDPITKAFGDVTREILSTDEQSVVLSGLDGDADGIYEVTARLLLTTSAGNIQLRPNGDSSNLKSLLMQGSSEIAEAATWRLASWSAVSTYHEYCFKLVLYAARTVNGVAIKRRYNFAGTRDAAATMETQQGGGVYDDAAANLTSLTFITNVVGGILAGSDIIVRRID